MATLTWLGHAAFLLDSDRGQADLRRPVPDRQPEDARRREAARPRRRDRVTHGHGDHVGDTVELSKRVPGRRDRLPGRAQGLARRAGRERRRDAGPEQGRLDRRSTASVHARQRLPLLELATTASYLGEACGIVIRLEDGRTVYFAGDTCVFGDMQLIRHLYEPDYAVLPIGDYFTMGPTRGRDRARHARQPARASRATGARSRC